MQSEEQSKAETTPPPDPDCKPRDHKAEYLPEPLIYCSCEPIDWPAPWYRRLIDRVVGWFR